MAFEPSFFPMGSQRAVRMRGGVAQNEESSWFMPSGGITRIMGFSFVMSLLRKVLGGQAGSASAGGSSYFMDSVMLFLLGTIAEAARRLFAWVIDRFKLFQYSITAQFTEGDPVYEWLIHLMTEEKIWLRSRQFRVTAASSLRQWTVNLEGNKTEGHVDEYAEYVPTYEDAQLFRFGGYWMEVKRGWGNNRINGQVFINGAGNVVGRLSLTIYTRDMGALSALVKEARRRYLETSRPHVVVHSIDQATAMHVGASPWSTAKAKSRRPLNSIILQEGVIKSLIDDAREFIKSEAWYTRAGIPHRRGYLLYGPPGTGKSSTIYAVAGELGLEIYSLSLAAGFVDDSFLARAVSSIPKRAIFLIEDIDCAFPSREDEEADTASAHLAIASGMNQFGMGMHAGRRPRSSVTLSGLLNVLDGVGSEEGKLFFATTNYIDRLDSALLRPGRIDKKIQYKLATKAQAAALFLRFYPPESLSLNTDKPNPTQFTDEKEMGKEKEKETGVSSINTLRLMADKFADAVPEFEFSTAELQGYLLMCKEQPEEAVNSVAAWVEQEKVDREARKQREEERKRAQKEKASSGETVRRGRQGAAGGSQAVAGTQGGVVVATPA
ncbi:P-loop containing nucleoside triphosphate hydrolase protein [Agrocybe pediades]|nr:P-loop containing nucleoside triphosphate hydrolase protein [Agrocybe pediades]